MLSGAPVSDHIGTVELTGDGNRTRIVYRVDTTPSIPVPESAWAAANKPVINRLLGAIVKESERRAGSRLSGAGRQPRICPRAVEPSAGLADRLAACRPAILASRADAALDWDAPSRRPGRSSPGPAVTASWRGSRAGCTASPTTWG